MSSLPTAQKASLASGRPQLKARNLIKHKQNLWGWILITPLTLGLVLWVLFPMGLSLITSLSKWDMISPLSFVGLQNYVDMFTKDKLFVKAVVVTIYYTLLSVPLQLALAFAVSMLLNTKVRGLNFFRTIYYLPSLIPVVVSSVMWLWLYNNQFGLLNALLEALGLDPLKWIYDSNQVVPSLVLMSLWSIGSIVIIFLAGLQGIPKDLSEAVSIDGGNAWHRFRHVTLPFMSPIILYNLVIGLINAIQIFTQPYVMTGGAPNNSSLTYMLYLYNQAFKYSKMGYANAMAWVLLVITVVLSLVVFRTSRYWVYYDGEKK